MTAIKIPIIQIRHKCIIAYEQHQYTSNLSRHSEAFKENAGLLATREKYKGIMTDGARKRLSKAIQLLLMSAKTQQVFNQDSRKWQSHRLSFITLTMPNVEKAKDSKFTHKYLLQPMLRVLRRRYFLNMYVWKSELQNNGSVHYHITSDCFIEFSKLRSEWNKILERNGLLEEFQKEYNHKNPNSVDVRKVRNDKDLDRYLMKYVMKEESQKASLKSKVWDCSKNLKEGKFFDRTADHESNQAIEREILKGNCKVVTTDFCTVYVFRHRDLQYLFSPKTQKDYYEHLSEIRNRSYEKENQEQKLQINRFGTPIFGPESHTLESGEELENLRNDQKPITRRFDPFGKGSDFDPYRNVVSQNEKVAHQMVVPF